MGTYVVTGSASGLGAATLTRLQGLGHRVIGVDQHEAEIVADLATPDGRERAVRASIAASDGRLEGVVSCAGLAPFHDTSAITRVNYFGAIAVLDGLRGALQAGDHPAAVGIATSPHRVCSPPLNDLNFWKSGWHREGRRPGCRREGTHLNSLH